VRPRVNVSLSPAQYFLGEAAQVKKSCVAAVLAIRPPPLDAAAHSPRARHPPARPPAPFDPAPPPPSLVLSGHAASLTSY